MTMLKNPGVKYRPFPPINLPDRQWPSRQITKAPRWLSTDLRDGNQALIDPMGAEKKMRFFDLLLKVGCKEIEVGFPASGATDFDFISGLVRQDKIPEDVAVQVLTQSRRDLIETIGGLIDKDFVDPAKAAVSGVSPASITNGVTPVVATGTTADHLRADVKTLMSNFIAANMSLSGAVWIMTETQALAIAMLLNPLGQPEFPGLSINGGTAGTFFGIPVILSENIPAQQAVAGPPAIPAGSRIILAKASEIMLADDGQVMLDASNQASLQMDNAPTNPPTATTVMVSLWQMNMVGIRAERFINWTKRRAGAVQYITGAAYA